MATCISDTIPHRTRSDVQGYILVTELLLQRHWRDRLNIRVIPPYLIRS